MADYCATPITLTLSIANGPSIDLMSDQQGFRVAEVDLGYPAVREDMNDAADRHGAADFTRLWGARAVAINGALVPSPYGSRQKAWHALAPFLNPAARITLTYQIDADTSSRTMTVRPSQVAATINNPLVSPSVQLGFKAADPLAYDAALQMVYAWAGAPGGGGRLYNLVFNRVYLAGGTNLAYATNNGDQTVYPLLRIYGPGNSFVVTEFNVGTPNPSITFASTFNVNAGDYIEVDCRRRTALLNGNPANNVYGQIVFGVTPIWPYMPPGVQTVWQLASAGYSSQTSMQVSWQDGYLI